jgi:hypothetical protein
MRLTHRIQQALQSVALLAAVPFAAEAQEPPTRGAVLARLQQEYVTARMNDDQTDLAAAGSILTLKKDDLVTIALSAGVPCANNYKDGKISQSTIAKLTCGRVITKRKVMLAGQKLWVTNIDVREGGVVFDLFTDPYQGEHYKATLQFPVPKGAIPNPEEMVKVVAEVFSAAPPPTPSADAASPEAAPAPAPSKPLAPAGRPAGAAGFAPAPAQDAPLPPLDVPPPPPAEPKTVSLGQSSDQVKAIFGSPDKIVKLGTKEIYFYQGLKVTFVNNKVSDVQ